LKSTEKQQYLRGLHLRGRCADQESGPCEKMQGRDSSVDSLRAENQADLDSKDCCAGAKQEQR